jgi:hypothetical protein
MLLRSKVEDSGKDRALAERGCEETVKKLKEELRRAKSGWKHVICCHDNVHSSHTWLTNFKKRRAF